MVIHCRRNADSGGTTHCCNQRARRVLQSDCSARCATDATAIHRLLLESGTAWADALSQIEQFCRSGNQLYKVPAVLKFWEASLKFQDAANRFWALVVSKSLQEWVRR